MKPRVLPYKPTYYELADKRRRFPIQVPAMSWNEYLQWPEELVNLRGVKKNID